MPAVGIGLLGLGTVGTGVLRVYQTHRALLEARAGCRLEIRAVATRTPDRPRPGLDLADWPLGADPGRVLDDPGVAVVLELVGGLEPARTWLLRAMAAGKHVVTANKALLATHGRELFAEARRRGVFLGFEAAVAGGIPIIRALRDGLAANRIQALYGIVNGTANYILSTMTDEGRPFDEVLREAQAQGYAEADPTLDVEGVDSAHKLQILASLAFGVSVDLKAIHTEGISRLSPQEIVFARELGYRLKLLAIAKATEAELEVRVHPTMIPADSPLAAVSGPFNAIFVAGDAVGDQMFYGRGAGQLPTASAVWSDALEIARRVAHGQPARPADLPTLDRPLRVRPMEEVSSGYYLRVMALDRPGVLSQIAGVLGRHQISIASVIQKGRATAATAVPVVMLTHEAREGAVRRALEEIDRLPVVAGQTVMLRVEPPVP